MEMKLNLGCDFDYREGWVNLDSYEGRADVVHDLNLFPYPFKDDTFDYILASHVLEHLEDTPKVMAELWRICKEGAIIEIKVPYYNNYNAFRDLTHIRFFTWDSFSIMALGKSRAKGGHGVGYLKRIFDYKERKLVWATTPKPFFKHMANFINHLVNINPNWMEKRIPYFITCESLHVKLIVRKEGLDKKDTYQEHLTDEKIVKLLKKTNKPYILSAEEWKRLHLRDLKKKGKSWSK